MFVQGVYERVLGCTAHWGQDSITWSLGCLPALAHHIGRRSCHSLAVLHAVAQALAVDVASSSVAYACTGLIIWQPDMHYARL